MIYSKNLKIIAVDEVGRGCLAGPVVACASMILNDEHLHKDIKDSKKLSFNKRIEIAKDIATKQNVIFAFAAVFNEKIDEINILNATMLAMKNAILQLIDVVKTYDEIIIDGDKVPEGINAKAIIKGDAKFVDISIASILAKVHRDKMMIDFHETCSNYKFNENFGYGTKFHFEAIKKFGITNIHRKSFLKNYLFN